MTSSIRTTPSSAGFGDEIASLYHNPFAGHSESSFTSAIRPKDGRTETKPTYRRRGSEVAAKKSRNDHEPWQDEDYGSTSSHARSKTLDAGPIASTSSTKLHPLALGRPGSASGGGFPSPSDTRPRLKRLLSDSSRGRRGEEAVGDIDDELPVTSPPPEQKVVIVHEVSADDSLAGVALKYGISLADLRRANQMWTSDSIHLRSVLFIPLEQAHRSKHLTLSLLEASSSSSADEDSLDEMETPVVERSPSSGRTNGLTIRRVPASQLSFFPPPAETSLSLDSHSSNSARTLPRSFQSSQKHESVPVGISSRTASGSSASSDPFGTPPSGLPLRTHIASLFNALPIAPSTRDTIIARLSLDSGASTPTQCSEEQEHELKDVSSSSYRKMAQIHQSPHLDINGNRSFARIKSRKSKTDLTSVELFFLNPNSLQSVSPPRNPHLGSSQSPPTTPSRHGKRLDYTSPEQSLERPEIIRTAQLEPSPAMQLPLMAKRDTDTVL